MPKTAPTAGLRSEINWLEPRSRSQLKMIRMFHRLVTMDDNLLTKKVFVWDQKVSEISNFVTWTKEVRNILSRNNFMDLFTSNIFDLKTAINNIKSNLHNRVQQILKGQCMNKPKLRTYKLVSEFAADKSYLYKPLSFVQRKFLAKLRLGVLPLRIETGRYERPKKSEEERKCKQCRDDVTESEIHFLLHCSRHSMLRVQLFSKVEDDSFSDLNDLDKFKFLVNNPEIAKQTAQYVIDAYDNRTTD